MVPTDFSNLACLSLALITVKKISHTGLSKEWKFIWLTVVVSVVVVAEKLGVRACGEGPILHFNMMKNIITL